MKLAVIACFCLAGCEGLRVFPSASLVQKADATCPDISDHDNVLFWGMILDGKDHSQGKSAYNWHDFKNAYKSLAFMMKEKPDEPLSYDLLMKARKICCNPEKQSTAFDWAAERPSAYEGAMFRGYACLECDHLKTIIDETPKAYMHVKKGTTNSFAKTQPKSCDDIESVRLRPKSIEKTQKLFKELIHEYNQDIKTKVTDEEKLARLATYLKEFAFLHPWGNGNGRFRTMMMNREVRRLGLGCGAMMYNNNKDLYYLKKETYVEKLQEGIAMYHSAVKTGTSPWVDEAVVAAHKERFAPEKVMPGLMDCEAAQSVTTGARTKKGSVE